MIGAIRSETAQAHHAAAVVGARAHHGRLRRVHGGPARVRIRRWARRATLAPPGPVHRRSPEARCRRSSTAVATAVGYVVPADPRRAVQHRRRCATRPSRRPSSPSRGAARARREAHRDRARGRGVRRRRAASAPSGPARRCCRRSASIRSSASRHLAAAGAHRARDGAVGGRRRRASARSSRTRSRRSSSCSRSPSSSSRSCGFGTSIGSGRRTVGRFLPGAASDALVGSSIFTSLRLRRRPAEPLEWWQGGLVLLGIAAIVTVLGYLTTWRRDIT